MIETLNFTFLRPGKLIPLGAGAVPFRNQVCHPGIQMINLRLHLLIIKIRRANRSLQHISLNLLLCVQIFKRQDNLIDDVVCRSIIGADQHDFPYRERCAAVFPFQPGWRSGAFPGTDKSTMGFHFRKGEHGLLFLCSLYQFLFNDQLFTVTKIQGHPVQNVGALSRLPMLIKIFTAVGHQRVLRIKDHRIFIRIPQGGFYFLQRLAGFGVGFLLLKTGLRKLKRTAKNTYYAAKDQQHDGNAD